MIKALDLQSLTQQHAAEYQAAVQRVIHSGWFLQGAETQQFEQAYAHYIGTPHCVAVANGLDALTLILRGYIELGVMSPGDEIIVPANTYIATILSITRNGLIPVLVEPTWPQLSLSVEQVAQAITPRTRGVMIVHLYGRLVYTPQLAQLCQRHQLKLIEDNAQAQGCSYEGTKTGALGDAAAHSFYPGKNIGAFGDAGAVTTADPQLAQVIRALGNYGSQRKYVFRYAGINSRMSEIDAAVLSVKLHYLDSENVQRQQLAHYYDTHLQQPLITLPSPLPIEQNVYHQYPIFTPHRDQLQQYLASCGIETLIHYPIPPHKQACFAQWNHLSFPITERIHAQELSLPMNPIITPQQAKTIVDAINNFRV